MNPNSIDKLFEAYLETDYVVTDASREIIIRIGERNSALDDLFDEADENTGAFLTAFNPRSNQLSLAENKSRQAELLTVLNKDNYKLFSGYGAGKDESWEPEPSFLILGIDKQKSLELARRFEQNAFVYLEKGNVPQLINSSEYSVY